MSIHEEQKQASRKFAVIGWLVGVAGVSAPEAVDMVENVDITLDDQAFLTEVCRPDIRLRGFLEGYLAAGGKVLLDER